MLKKTLVVLLIVSVFVAGFVLGDRSWDKRTKYNIRDLLRRVPLYDELLQAYPEADAVQMPRVAPK